MTRDPFRDYKARLDALGFTPRRSLGQNFLLDGSLHEILVQSAELTRADLAVEVGIGLGFLTRALVASAQRVIGFEIDSRLLELVQAEHVRWPDGDRLSFVAGDILGGAKARRESAGNPAVHRLHPEFEACMAAWRNARDPAAGGGVAVVANLPYRVSGPFLGELGLLEQLPDRVVVLIQKDLADRLVAPPQTKERGILSVWLQALFEIRFVRNVGREVFRPRPQVDSAIVAMTPRGFAPALATADAGARVRVREVIRALFANRRKRIHAALVRTGVGAQLGEGRLDALGDLRAEALDDASWNELFSAVLAGAES